MNQPKKILICRTDRIGDVVLTLPLAVLLKKHFPGCSVSFLARAYTAPLLSNCRAVDEVIVLPEKNGAADTRILTPMLAKAKFDLALVVYPRPRIAYSCLCAGIPVRVGTANRWYSFMFNKKVNDHRKEVKYHELEYNVRMLMPLGITPSLPLTEIEYGLTLPGGGTGIEDIDAGLSGGKPVIIIHPGSGGSAMDWPEEKFRLLVENLAAADKYSLFITGSQAEHGLCTRVAGNTDVKILAGRLNLQQLMVMIAKSDIFVANSTGPLHIAAAFGKFVIGFYPKIRVCSPERWGPYTSKKAVFTPPIDCVNCSREQCERLNCMSTIEVPSVLEQIEKFSSNESIMES